MIEDRSQQLVHLTVATNFSYGKAIGSPAEYMKLAAGVGAIGVAEFGTMRSLRDLAKAAKTDGIKLVPGVRLLWCPDANKRGLSREEKEKLVSGLLPSAWATVIAQYEQRHGYAPNVRELGHVCIWALDDEALGALYEVSSRAWIDGFFYEPRVDAKILSYMRGLYAVSLGGMNGPIGKLALKGRTADAIDLFRRRHELFDMGSGTGHVEGGARELCVEVHALPIVQCRQWNEFVARELLPLGAKLILTQPVHYPTRAHADAQRAMEAITNPRISSMHDAGMPGDFWHYATLDELRATADATRVPLFDEAVANTNSIADLCTAKFRETPNACITPAIDLKGEAPVTRLERLARAGIAKLRPEWPQEYEERLMHELGSLERQNFVQYVLYVADVIEMARDLEIPLGPGRGSAAGSLTLWLLGVTSPHLDPIQHGLLFSRFIDPQRVAPPDVDIDVSNPRRDELIDAMRQRYGKDCVAHITNFNTMRGRGCAADVCRVLDVPLGTTRKLTGCINEELDEGAIELAFQERPEAIEIDRAHPQIRPLCLLLEGAVRTLGIHAGGVVCSPEPLWRRVPVETRSRKDEDDRVLVTAFDMKGVEATGLLKLDALGLKTVHLVSSAEAIVRRTDPSFSLDSIPLDDRATLDAFTAQDFSAVFQYDTHSSYRLCAGVVFKCFADVSTMTALNRPGPLDCGMADEFIKRRKGLVEVPVDYHEIVSQICKDTLGVIVYQEQIMAIATLLCKYENSDGLRKMVGKKLMAELEAEGPRFIAAARANSDISEEKANKLWADIVTAGRYVFNKSHSDAYALIAYMCQYLKVHHAEAFYTAALNIEDDSGRVRSIVADAASHNVPMLPPDVNSSGSEFVATGRGVMCSLGHLRGVGPAAGAAIVASRPYASFDDFMTRVNRTVVNSRVVKILAAAGAFGEMVDNPRAIHDAWEVVQKDRSRKKPKYASWSAGFAASCAERWSITKAKLEMAKANPAMADDPFEEFLQSSHVRPHPAEMREVNGQSCWLAGCVNDRREDQIGRFGDRSGPEAELRKGALFCTFMLVHGDSKIRVKVDWSEYPNCKEATLDGKFVAVHGTFDAQYSTFRAHAVLDLAVELEQESQLGACMMGRSPLLLLSRPDKPDRYNWNLERVIEQAERGEFGLVPVAGIVTHVRPKLDAKGKSMAFVGILHPKGAYVEATFFASGWTEPVQAAVRPGAAISATLEINEYRGRTSWICGRDSELTDLTSQILELQAARTASDTGAA